MSESCTNNTRQAAWVAVGTFLAFLVGIITPMVLSRFFTKEDYGTYKQVMYVYTTLLSVFTLGLPRAYGYFLPKFSASCAKDVINKISRLFYALGLLFSIFLFAFSGIIATLLKNPDLGFALKVFSPTPLFLLPTMGLDAIYASFRKTKVLAAYTTVTKVLTMLCIILPVILFDGTYIHAIIGFDIASFITFVIAVYMMNLPVKGTRQEPSSLDLRQIFGFSIPLVFASLWGMIIQSSDQFFVSRYFGNEVFADFSNGFTEIPFVAMIVGALSTVLLPLFSKMDKGQGMSEESFLVFRSVVVKSSKLIVPMLVYSIAFAGIIMTCMYGAKYESSAVYFQIKNASCLFYIIPFTPIFLGLGLTKEYSRVHMYAAVGIVIAEYVLVKVCDSAISIALASGLCQLIKIIAMFVIISRIASKKVLDLFPVKDFLKILTVSVISAIAGLFLIKVFDINVWWALVISFFAFVITYYVLCICTKVTYKDIAASFISGGRLSFVMKIIP